MKKALGIAAGIIGSLVLMATTPVTSFADTSTNTGKTATSVASTTTNPSPGTIVVTIGSTTVVLKQGQKVEIPLVPVTSTSTNSGTSSPNTGSISNSVSQPNVVFPGNGGTLSLWPQNGRVYWDITVDFPATSFAGVLSVTDLTSGLSGGVTPVNSFAGNIPYSNLSGHQYGASLNGQSYFLGAPVESTVPNYIIWTAPM